MKILQKPNTEPFGDIIEMPIQWNQIDEFEWNPHLNIPLWSGAKTDNTKYVECINGHFVKIPVGNCRICTKKITPYKKKYFQRHYESGSKYSLLFDCEHFYCEECAKKEASKDFFNDVVPAEVNRFETRRDGETLETVVYADGSRLEEMTSYERPQYD